MHVEGRKEIPRRNAGFSLLEMVIAITIMMVISALTAPSVMRGINAINVHYSAQNLSGLMQTARIQAVKKNTFYSIQPMALSGNVTGYYVDLNKNLTYASGDTVVTMAGRTTVTAGGGSGAPNETAFIANLGFAVAAGTNPVSFNSRGLPCIAVSATQCPQSAATGFVYFVSTVGTFGQVSWAAVAVTPSGRAQIWTCDSSGNWVQR